MSSALPPDGALQGLEDHLRQSVAASSETILQIRAELDDSKRRAKRWRDKADQAEEQTKRFCEDMDNAFRLRCSLEFEALCLALRRNDSATTTVESFRFPLGYGESLGKALHRNTHVSSILLRLNELIPLLEGGRYSATQIERGLRPLLHFISTSKSMRHVVVKEPHPDNSASDILVELLLKAVFTNRDNIDELALAVPRIPADAFECTMRGTMLQTLDVHFGDSHEYDSEDRRMIGEAFRQIVSLRTLNLHSNDSRLIRSILVGLSNGTDPYQLRDLRLSCVGETQTYWSAMSQFLTMKGPLDHLHLESARFDLANMAHLIDGLKGGNGSTTIASVSRLTFDCCHFDRDSKALWTSLMRTRVDLSDTASATSSLRELTFAGDDGFNWSGSNLAGLICLQRDGRNEEQSTDSPLKLQATIGSQVQHLSVSNLESNFPGFLRSMTKYARQIRLHGLSVCGVDEDDSTDLIECVSKIPSLRELVVDEVDHFELVVARLKRNDTIHRISFPGLEETAESRLACAYAERNQWLEPLLLTSLESAHDATEDRTKKCQPNDSLKLCPSLLEASAQISSSKSSALSRALVLLRDSIGPL